MKARLSITMVIECEIPDNGLESYEAMKGLEAAINQGWDDADKPVIITNPRQTLYMSKIDLAEEDLGKLS